MGHTYIGDKTNKNRLKENGTKVLALPVKLTGDSSDDPDLASASHSNTWLRLSWIRIRESRTKGRKKNKIQRTIPAIHPPVFMKITGIHSQQYVRMSAQNGTSYLITNYYVFMKITSQQFTQNYIKFNDLKHKRKGSLSKQWTADSHRNNTTENKYQMWKQLVDTRCSWQILNASYHSGRNILAKL